MEAEWHGPRQWGLPDRLLHCGISVAPAAKFMAVMGHQLARSGQAYHVRSWSRKRTLPGLLRPPGRVRLAGVAQCPLTVFNSCL